jgi:pyruvate kinase
LNFSHGTHEEHARRIKWIRKASLELDKPVAIIQDLQGPKVRLGDFDDVIQVKSGDELRFQYGANYAETGIIPTQYNLAEKMKEGERIFLFDGRVRTVVTGIKNGVVHAVVENDGWFMKRKGINLPDTDFAGDVITTKDREDLKFGATQDVDYVAQSFVQTADDLRVLRGLMQTYNMEARLIVKFETKAAVDHMEEIVKEADAVMVARGDLAGETTVETVPIVESQLIGLGMRYAKPTVVATQMMVSMTESPTPTRAEVSDVATAIILGADCVMLSEETAAGQYPIEVVQTMKRIILRTERDLFPKMTWPEHEDHSRQTAISRGIYRLATDIRAKAIVAETKTGTAAILTASWRPSMPVIAVTNDIRTAQQLAIVYGIKSYLRPAGSQAGAKLTDWLSENQILQTGDIVVIVSGRQPGVPGTTDTIKVRVIE